MKEQYHFIGIGGIGMGALAILLLEKGYAVGGSDIKKNYMTDELEKRGAHVHIGHHAANIGQADIVVYSSAIVHDNPELIEARKRNLPILQRAKLLANLMQEHEAVTIAGAHGKTTTTSMISNLLLKAGLKPTTAVGGIVGGTTVNARLGEGKYFVAEVDESDGSFLYFAPQYSVITNIDVEHLDYYKNWENILKAYREFIGRTKPNGRLFICREDQNLLTLVKESGRSFETYGFALDNHLSAQHVRYDAFHSFYECFKDGKKIGDICLQVPGKHNILNSLACVSVGLSLNISFSTIQQSLKDYREVKRRFQLLTNVNGIRLIDDYAHHPTEINMTLEAAQRIKQRQLIAVFQPHRYTRLQSLYQEFLTSLKNTDHLIVTDVYAASEQPIEGMSAKQIVEDLKKTASIPVVYLHKENIIEYVLGLAESGDMIVMLGAGDITKVAHECAEQLNIKYKTAVVLNEKVKV
jgi:UDP-N-acetylmuramate--alanine ligase